VDRVGGFGNTVRSIDLICRDQLATERRDGSLAQLADMPMSVRRHAPGKPGAARVTGSLCSASMRDLVAFAQGSSARAPGLTSPDAARSTTATWWRTSAANIPHLPPYGRFASPLR
jgi:hypothetical protein